MTECEHLKDMRIFSEKEAIDAAEKLVGEPVQTIIIAIRYKNQPHGDGKEHSAIAIVGDGTTKTDQVIRLVENIHEAVASKIARRVVREYTNLK